MAQASAFDQDFVDGYRDGFDPEAPEPAGNRSHRYRHGFQNGRDDRRQWPRASAEVLRFRAQTAEIADGGA